MTNTHTCHDTDGLLDYLYGEGDDQSRARVEQHLAGCASCQRELHELQGVRAQLTHWSAERDDLDFAVPVARDRWRAGVGRWSLAAAAVLVLAVGAAIANVQVTAGPDGLSVRTGWARTAPPVVTEPAVAPATNDEAWRAELAALESRLRGEIVAAGARTTDGGARAVANPADSDRRLRELIAESEARQEREFALRMAQLTNEVEAQRRADILSIERGFGLLEGSAGAEAARQRELLDYLVRVSQQR